MTGAPSRVLSVTEVAAHFGTTPRTVRTWIRQGLLSSSSSTPRGRRFSEADLAAFSAAANERRLRTREVRIASLQRARRPTPA